MRRSRSYGAGEASSNDPELADRFSNLAPQLLTRLDSEPTWDAVLSAEPGPARRLTPDELEAVSEAIGNFADIRSPYTFGHSAGVAAAAASAARRLGMPERDVTDVYRAGQVHDLGRSGVPVAVWNKDLVPDKAAAIAEMHRVLRPGGRLQAADIVLARPVSASSKQDVTLWTGCIAGGLLADELVALVRAAGFSDVELVPGADVFAGAPQQSSAADFGTRGVGIRARR
jgi:HD domain